jgi:uncharacterized protein
LEGELFRVVNLTRQETLAESAKRCVRFLDRFRGLLFTKSLGEGCALIIEPCKSIHMFGMAYPIDVIFLDKENRVTALVHEIKPWRASGLYLKAVLCIELPAGTIAKSGTRMGDSFAIT